MSAFGAVKDAVSGGLSKIRNLFPFSPAKEGPFSGRGWVLYSGLSIGQAMGDGIRRSSGQAITAAAQMAAATQAQLNDLSTPHMDVGKSLSSRQMTTINHDTASTDPSMALHDALSGLDLRLVLDDGTALDAHLETVTAGVLATRRSIAGRRR